jgi:hypothetical protein
LADAFLKTGSLKDDYPKVECPRPYFLKDTSKIHKLILPIQQTNNCKKAQIGQYSSKAGKNYEG